MRPRCKHSTPVTKTSCPELLLCRTSQLLLGGECKECGCLLCITCVSAWQESTPSCWLQLRAVCCAQAVDHAMNARDVVVGGAHELEQALQWVLAQHPRPCRQSCKLSMVVHPDMAMCALHVVVYVQRIELRCMQRQWELRAAIWDTNGSEHSRSQVQANSFHMIFGYAALPGLDGSSILSQCHLHKRMFTLQCARSCSGALTDVSRETLLKH